MKSDYPLVCESAPCELDECCEPLGTCEEDSCSHVTNSSGVEIFNYAARTTPKRCNQGFCTLDDCCYEHGVELIARNSTVFLAEIKVLM